MNWRVLAADVDPEPSRPYRESKALIGQGHRHGCVLEYTGTHLEIEMDGGYVSDLGDLGLDDAPMGLSIWEGHYHYDPGYDSPNGPAEPSSEPVGKFRKLTPEEWTKLATDGFLWPVEDDNQGPANEDALDLTGTS